MLQCSLQVHAPPTHGRGLASSHIRGFAQYLDVIIIEQDRNLLDILEYKKQEVWLDHFFYESHELSFPPGIPGFLVVSPVFSFWTPLFFAMDSMEPCEAQFRSKSSAQPPWEAELL